MKYGQNLMLVTIFQRKFVQSSEKPERMSMYGHSCRNVVALPKIRHKLNIGIPLRKSKIFGGVFYIDIAKKR